jgi:hypothetical protein
MSVLENAARQTMGNDSARQCSSKVRGRVGMSYAKDGCLKKKEI